MSFVESLRTFASPQPAPLPQAQVWDCSSRGQVLAAAFEVHEAAMNEGYMPDEATRLSMALAELAAHGGLASVYFLELGWRVEVAPAAGGPVLSASYQRVENA
ncbi:MAG: hypothetical protein Q8L48_37855 [Archangium sp.]|nr:hypothetical protein [Archangium sp.]